MLAAKLVVANLNAIGFIRGERRGLGSLGVPMPQFVSFRAAGGLVALGDLTEGDVPAIVDYWLGSGDEFLEFLGVDRARLGAAQDIYGRFSSAIRTGDPNQERIALRITLDGRIVGYTLLNRYSAYENYSHWHILSPNLRARGLSTALYPYRIKAYFDVAPIARLIHQTRTRNVGVNRMLDKFIPVSETRFVKKPDGVGSSGEFHIRYVTREDIAGIFARAAELGGKSG